MAEYKYADPNNTVIEEIETGRSIRSIPVDPLNRDYRMFTATGQTPQPYQAPVEPTNPELAIQQLETDILFKALAKACANRFGISPQTFKQEIMNNIQNL